VSNKKSVNPKIVAESILKNVGGKENIKSMEHCATRLRLILKDKELIDEDTIENIEGVKGQFFAAGQYQIILGTGFVNKVFEEMENIGVEKGDIKEDTYDKMTILQKISRILGDIFLPIIPVLVATGLFMGLRGLITNLGVELNPTFNVFSQILTDVAFIFLPALIAWSTIKRFGGTPVIGIVLGLMLVAPQLPNAWEVASGAAEPLKVSLFGMNLALTGYQGSVIPALFVGILAANIEKRLRKIVPDVLDLIVTPFLTLLVSMLLGLLVIGPIMHGIEKHILSAFTKFLALPMGLGGLIIGGLNQLIVVTGVHHVFNALEINLLAETGLNPFNAIITGAIAAQGAATLAVAFKTKDKKRRSLYISSAIPAFLGITEPAIFGINLRYIKPFIFALVGGAVAGMFASLINLAGAGMGITVIPGALLYIGGNIVGYILTNLIGMAVSFILTYAFFNEHEMKDDRH